MSSGDIVAYIGAAAWLPQIVHIFYKFITKPKLRFYYNNTVELSYTSFGPIFNLRMNLLSNKKPLLIEDLSVEIKHTDGDVHILRWVGITEMQSEISDNNGNKQYITKDYPAIAINLFQDLLTEKFIKFQEPKFHEKDLSLQNELLSHMNFLKSKSSSDFSKETMESEQYHKLVASRNNFFWWKPGEYTVTVNAKSFDSFSLENNIFKFKLNQTDIDLLRFNIPNISKFINCQITQSDEIENIKWNWLNPKILK
ncbi:hypothetical protein OGX90_17730 [Citrobacter sp. Cpo012]|uniref:hypothetical protein n=1 Tax=Citrobacter sp. Cpo012 TaxID=2985120 RepID=UPI002576454F|nr:hypothetical protein [Citrobacter sp. Cpo012]MDM2911751.1 hypothetical protein [Citrobacter sp. Cpo012]